MSYPSLIMVPAGVDKVRLDRFLVDRLPTLSRSMIQRWIREQQISLNGLPTTCSQLVKEGDRITIQPSQSRSMKLLPDPIPLQILYEDEDLVVIDKPAGMVVHPGAGTKGGTLVHALLAHCEVLSGIGGVERPGIVHRLDKGTSGVIVVAKHDLSHVRLSEQFAARRVIKQYVAICHGRMQASGAIDLPIGRHPTMRKKMSTRSRRGREAHTDWRQIETYGKLASKLEVYIGTGRTHQIRVHLAAIDHPLLGDKLYGSRRMEANWPEQLLETLRSMGRPALHAQRLQLIHPITGEPCCWEAPVPEDMERMMEALRLIVID